MEETPLSGPFRWYNEHTRGALPPKSLFLMLLMLLLVLALPALGLWMREFYPLLTFVGLGMVALLTGLVFDVLATYRRYLTWDGQWLCGDCRKVFSPGLVGAKISPLS